jgi:hypothetical protein
VDATWLHSFTSGGMRLIDSEVICPTLQNGAAA